MYYNDNGSVYFGFIFKELGMSKKYEICWHHVPEFVEWITPQLERGIHITAEMTYLKMQEIYWEKNQIYPTRFPFYEGKRSLRRMCGKLYGDRELWTHLPDGREIKV